MRERKIFPTASHLYHGLVPSKHDDTTDSRYIRQVRKHHANGTRRTLFLGYDFWHGLAVLRRLHDASDLLRLVVRSGPPLQSCDLICWNVELVYILVDLSNTLAAQWRGLTRCRIVTEQTLEWTLISVSMSLSRVPYEWQITIMYNMLTRVWFIKICVVFLRLWPSGSIRLPSRRLLPSPAFKREQRVPQTLTGQTPTILTSVKGREHRQASHSVLTSL